MWRSTCLRVSILALVGAAMAGCQAGAGASPDPPRSTSYDDLVTLFQDWRAFQKPNMVNGVPDYTASAMSAQHKALAGYQKRLAAVDPSGWPVSRRADYELVKAEMNGLDFDHRVKRPWSRSPSFYIMFYPSRSDQPLREGAHVEGSIELWTFEPLTGDRVPKLAARLASVAPLLEQAKKNLTENCHDLWTLGIREMKQQSAELAAFAKTVAASNPDLVRPAQEARDATERFLDWLQRELPARNGPSGIGVDNYTWYLNNVQLVPYTWSDELAMLNAELARADAALKLEEFHNRNLPPLNPIQTEAEYRKRFDAAVTEYIGMLRDRDVLTVRSYMEPALRARGRFTPPDQYEFFNQVSARDPIIMLAHNFHWWDLAQMEASPHASPIRRGSLLYSINDSRTEGFASAMEEMNLDAGLYDTHPRVRELIYAIVAERCAVALGDLLMASNQLTIEEAVKLASARTPRGWLSETSRNVWGADGEGLYLTQPTYGTSYTIGKIEILGLLGDRARQLGDAFTVKKFIDEFTSSGLIPVSMIRWELTGLDDEVKRMASRR
jgi:Bacterial protein of unknown function (DUF885)